MTKKEIDSKLQELRKQYKNATRENQKIIEIRAKLLKLALEKTNA